MQLKEILEASTIDTKKNILYLPQIQLDRETYLEVKAALELIGGKWKGGKTQGFVFKENPSLYIQDLIDGKTRNVKQEYQFFATPAKLSDYLVQLADLSPNQTILEPSAGQGSIVKAIAKVLPEQTIDCYELLELNRKILLETTPTANLLGEDFLNAPESIKYDHIIANPPFSKNQDIKHIKKMWELLSPNGRLVTIASIGWIKGSLRIHTEFREWLDLIKAEYQLLPENLFIESGTSVPSCVIVAEKDRQSATSFFANKPFFIELPKKPSRGKKEEQPNKYDELDLTEVAEELIRLDQEASRLTQSIVKDLQNLGLIHSKTQEEKPEQQLSLF